MIVFEANFRQYFKDKAKVLIIIKQLSYKLQKVAYFVLVVLCIFSIQTIFAESSDISIEIERDEGSVYSKYENIIISGNVGGESGSSIISITDPNGIVVWAEPISIDIDGNFSITVEAGISNWYKSGNYEVKLESGDVNAATFFFYDSGQQVNPPSAIEEFYVSQSDLYLTFSIAVIIVIGVFVFLARCAIFRRKSEYDKQKFDSQKDRDYEKYHSDWTAEEVFGERTENNSESRKEFAELFKEKTLPNYYEILGLSAVANDNEIKSMYRKLAKEWHPDKGKANSEKIMAEINEAYETLSDKKLRAEYDKFYNLL